MSRRRLARAVSPPATRNRVYTKFSNVGLASSKNSNMLNLLQSRLLHLDPMQASIALLPLTRNGIWLLNKFRCKIGNECVCACTYTPTCSSRMISYVFNTRPLRIVGAVEYGMRESKCYKMGERGMKRSGWKMLSGEVGVFRCREFDHVKKLKPYVLRIFRNER